MIWTPVVQNSTTDTLHEIAQNAYDLVGAVMAIECVTGCKEQLVETYTEEDYNILLVRLLDLFDQHAKEIATLRSLARERLAAQPPQKCAAGTL